MSAVKMKAKLHPRGIAEATRIEFYSKEAAFGASFAGLDEGDNKGRKQNPLARLGLLKSGGGEQGCKIKCFHCELPQLDINNCFESRLNLQISKGIKQSL